MDFMVVGHTQVSELEYFVYDGQFGLKDGDPIPDVEEPKERRDVEGYRDNGKCSYQIGVYLLLILLLTDSLLEEDGNGKDDKPHHYALDPRDNHRPFSQLKSGRGHRFRYSVKHFDQLISCDLCQFFGHGVPLLWGYR